ncbi:putative membrane protein insertion efficiency factor [Spirochaetia bacterium]|nr:putative membrane protein insertion efficiency factor [Spirochaetia bacterium]
MAVLQKAMLLFIRLYQQAVSPHFPPVCRYAPSCSAYTYEAVRKYGAFRGAFLGLKRFLRCHPFHPGGYDPVPEDR